MAVLVRSTRRSLPALRRALLAAGVPIAAPPDELPLARQPAVVPLLMVLRFAARPQELDADAATALLTSPLGSADPMRMRRLRRGLLRLSGAAARTSDHESAPLPPSSAAARTGDHQSAALPPTGAGESGPARLDRDRPAAQRPESGPPRSGPPPGSGTSGSGSSDCGSLTLRDSGSGASGSGEPGFRESGSGKSVSVESKSGPGSPSD